MKEEEEEEKVQATRQIYIYNRILLFKIRFQIEQCVYVYVSIKQITNIIIIYIYYEYM